METLKFGQIRYRKYHTKFHKYRCAFPTDEFWKEWNDDDAKEHMKEQGILVQKNRSGGYTIYLNEEVSEEEYNKYKKGGIITEKDDTIRSAYSESEIEKLLDEEVKANGIPTKLIENEPPTFSGIPKYKIEKTDKLSLLHF